MRVGTQISDLCSELRPQLTFYLAASTGLTFKQRDSSFFHPMGLSWLTSDVCLTESWRGLGAVGEGRGMCHCVSRPTETLKETGISSAHCLPFNLADEEKAASAASQREGATRAESLCGAHSRASKVGHSSK